MSGTIIAVEQHPENYAMLCENIRRNGLESRIVPVLAAASDREGVARLAFSTTDNTGGHHLTSSAHHRSVEVRTVDALELLEKSGPDTLLKIDLEGREYPIFRRLQPRLALVGTIAGELHTSRFCAPRHSVDLLRRHGFSIKLDGDPRIPSFIALSAGSTL